jgi:hypothetical protein
MLALHLVNRPVIEAVLALQFETIDTFKEQNRGGLTMKGVASLSLHWDSGVFESKPAGAFSGDDFGVQCDFVG